MSVLARRLKAIEKQARRRRTFLPRYIPLLAYDDPEAVRLRAEDRAASDGEIRAIFLVGVEPDPSRFNETKGA